MIIREHKKVKDVKLREQTSIPISFLLKSTPVFFSLLFWILTWLSLSCGMTKRAKKQDKLFLLHCTGNDISSLGWEENPSQLPAFSDWPCLTAWRGLGRWNTVGHLQLAVSNSWHVGHSWLANPLKTCPQLHVNNDWLICSFIYLEFFWFQALVLNVLDQISVKNNVGLKQSGLDGKEVAVCVCVSQSRTHDQLLYVATHTHARNTAQVWGGKKKKRKKNSHIYSTFCEN